MEQYCIELAHREQVAELPAIERAAAALFPEDMLPKHTRDSALPLDQLAEAQARQASVGCADFQRPAGRLRYGPHY